MKRLFLAVFALLIAVSASAQYAIDPSSPSEIRVRGSKIICDGEKLTKDQAAVLFSDFGGLDRGEEYLSNRAGYRTGVGLSAGGAAVFVVGVPASYVATAFAVAYGLAAGLGGEEVPVGIPIALYSTYGATLAGALIMLAGIPTAAVYQHRIKTMANEYNELSYNNTKAPVLTFGPTKSGVGMAINF